MKHCAPETSHFLSGSSLYQEYVAEREEILRHKWLRSEESGRDIGFERALLEWIRHHRDGWRTARRKRAASSEHKRNSARRRAV